MKPKIVYANILGRMMRCEIIPNKPMNITLGKTEVSLLNPPNNGVVIQGTESWNIGRNGQGMIVLRRMEEATSVHPEFRDGMDLQTFCEWINSKL